MSQRSLCAKLVIAACLALFAPCLWAQDGAQGALSKVALDGPFQRTLVVANLDDDKKLDGAVLLDSSYGRFKIQLHFTDRPDAELTFEAIGQKKLSLTAWDIDNDGDTDLVVEEAFTHKPLRVWINEGHGDFHEGRLQDFLSLAAETHEQLQPPINQRDGGALCLLVERGFESGILTAPQFGRPPSGDRSQVLRPVLFADSRVRIPTSSRAPPLL
jgi:hypothetical protein